MNNIWLISAFVVLCTISAVIEGRTARDLDLGYEWKPLKKFIPDNAVAGGQDENGYSYYIGRSKYGKDAVVPGYIIEDTMVLNIAMDSKGMNITENIEILCCNEQDNLQWVETAGTELRMAPHLALIRGGYDEGGYDKGYALAIGKMTWNGCILPGNARLNRDHEGIAFKDNEGKFQKETGVFEVLVYDRCAFAPSGGRRKHYGYI